MTYRESFTTLAPGMVYAEMGTNRYEERVWVCMSNTGVLYFLCIVAVRLSIHMGAVFLGICSFVTFFIQLILLH